MRENGPIVVLVAALLAIFGIRSFSPEGAVLSTGEPKGTRVAASEPGEKERRAAGGEQPADEETLGPLWPAHDFQNTRNLEDQNAKSLDVSGCHTRYLIVCVPDPLDSSSDYRFDYLIDAIQRAAETQHFVLDRYYYPWPNKKLAQASPMLAPFEFGVQGAFSEEASRKREVHFTAQSKPTKDPKKWPGLIQFRGPLDSSGSGYPQLLQVFLVGETATEGIHKQAFTACLDRIGMSTEYKENRTVRILGPHFSGSQVSLKRTLQAWTLPVIGASSVGLLASPGGGGCFLAATALSHGRMQTFTIISGNAMAVEKAELEASCWPAQVTFLSTIIPEREVLKKTLHYLGVADDSCGRLKFNYPVAFLEESNTTFGDSTTKNLLESKKGYEPTHFPFPLRISEVRTAYQEGSDATENNFPNLPSFGSRLRLPLKGGQPRDTEPSLTPGMSAVATERILGTMFNTIARERFPYALILATDLKDQLFLAILLRQYCPETRLILSSNYLLFSHPDVSAALRGTIVGSTYPLYPRNQHWSGSTDDAELRHIIFPSEEAQAYYNATIALLNRRDSRSLLEYGRPFPALHISDSDPLRPPIWVNIVAQGGPFPLAVFPLTPNEPGTDYVQPRAVGSAGGGVFRPSYPTLWIMLVMGIALLLGYVFYAYFAALWGCDRWWKSASDGEKGWELRMLFWPRKDTLGAGRWCWRQWLYAFLCLTSVLVLYAYLTFIWLIPIRHWWRYDGVSVRVEGLDYGSLFLGFLLLLVAAAFVALWVRGLFLWGSVGHWLGRARHSAWSRLQPLYSWLREACRSAWNRLQRSPTAPKRETEEIKQETSLVGTGVGKPSSPNPNPAQTKRQTSESLSLLLLGALRIFDILGVWSWLSATTRPAAKNQPIGKPSSPNPNPAQTESQTNEPLHLLLLDALPRLILFILLVVSICYFTMRQHKEPKPAEWLMFFDRATSLASGVSPAVPVFFLAMAFFCWSYVQLKRLYLIESHAIKNPFSDKEYFDEKDFNEKDKGRHKELMYDLCFPARILKRRSTWVVLVVLLFTIADLASYFIRSVVDFWTESLVFLGLAVLALLIVYSWLHLYRVWKSIRELLEALARFHESFGEGLKRIPPSISAMFGPYLWTSRPRRRGQEQARLERLKQIVPDCERVKDYLQKSKDLTAAKLLQAMNDPNAAIPEPKRENLCNAAQACFTLLGQVWSDPALAEKFAESSTLQPAETAPAVPPSALSVKKWVESEPGRVLIEDIETKDDDKLARSWLLRVHDFVALEVTVYLSQFFVHLRNLILFLTIAPILMLLAVAFYPLQPQRLWLLLAGTLIVVVTATVLWIVIQIERNEVVSNIVSTTPNRVNLHWQFLGHILVYAAPLLGVVVAASSGASDLVHALVDPLIQALR